jgi:predicted outer membrane protein
MGISRWLLCASCLAMPATLSAQQADPPAERAPQRERRVDERQPQERAQPERGARTAGQLSPVEHFFVKCLTLGNQGEVTISKIAQQRATNPQVKAFAEQMIQDHSKMLTQLQKFSGDTTATPATGATPSLGEAPPAREREAAPGREPAEAPQTAQRGAAPPAREAAPERRIAADPAAGSRDLQTVGKILTEVHKRCMASAMEELESKKGEEFDKCYVGMQVAGHQKMVSELAVLKDSINTPELRQLIMQGHETTTQHLTHAKNLMETLAKGDTATARKPADAERE